MKSYNKIMWPDYYKARQLPYKYYCSICLILLIDWKSTLILILIVFIISLF